MNQNLITHNTDNYATIQFPFFDCNYIPLSVHLQFLGGSWAWKSAKLVAISCQAPHRINYSFIVFRCGQSLTIFGLCLSHSHLPNWFACHLYWPRHCRIPNVCTGLSTVWHRGEFPANQSQNPFPIFPDLPYQNHFQFWRHIDLINLRVALATIWLTTKLSPLRQSLDLSWLAEFFFYIFPGIPWAKS